MSWSWVWFPYCGRICSQPKSLRIFTNFIFVCWSHNLNVLHFKCLYFCKWTFYISCVLKIISSSTCFMYVISKNKWTVYIYIYIVTCRSDYRRGFGYSQVVTTINDNTLQITLIIAHIKSSIHTLSLHRSTSNFSSTQFSVADFNSPV
jgi:hypothetical protein